MSKAFRHEQILKLIRARSLHSQGELAEALQRGGLAATQVTLSRDLKELGVIKTPAGYAHVGPAAAPDAAPAAELARILREFVRDLRPAQNLLLLKCDPGAAARVGVALDAARWGELAGSIAGDDTILLVCENQRRRLLLERRLRLLLKG